MTKTVKERRQIAPIIDVYIPIDGRRPAFEKARVIYREPKPPAEEPEPERREAIAAMNAEAKRLDLD